LFPYLPPIHSLEITLLHHPVPIPPADPLTGNYSPPPSILPTAHDETDISWSFEVLLVVPTSPTPTAAHYNRDKRQRLLFLSFPPFGNEDRDGG